MFAIPAEIDWRLHKQVRLEFFSAISASSALIILTTGINAEIAEDAEIAEKNSPK